VNWSHSLLGFVMQSSELVQIRRDYLLAGSALVPPHQRATFFALLLVGPDGLVPDVADTTALATNSDLGSPRSFPLNADQARELKNKIDPATWALIEAAVGNLKNGVATIEWSEAKRLTGATHWGPFAQGRMGGLHRSLRGLVGVPKDAVLLWGGEGWNPDGEGDYLSGTLAIDGPAVQTLRAVCGL